MINIFPLNFQFNIAFIRIMNFTIIFKQMINENEIFFYGIAFHLSEKLEYLFLSKTKYDLLKLVILNIKIEIKKVFNRNNYKMRNYLLTEKEKSTRNF